jgi:hypothetical protein
LGGAIAKRLRSRSMPSQPVLDSQPSWKLVESYFWDLMIAALFNWLTVSKFKSHSNPSSPGPSPINKNPA